MSDSKNCPHCGLPLDSSFDEADERIEAERLSRQNRQRNWYRYDDEDPDEYCY